MNAQIQFEATEAAHDEQSVSSVPDSEISDLSGEDFSESMGEEGKELVQADGVWQLQRLKPRHKEALALMAQGVPMVTIARACNYTPTYISMLARMPICKEYIAGLSAASDLQIEAMYVKSVEVIGSAMQVGTVAEQLKAAKLQLEVTKRIGRRDEVPQSPVNSEERLLRLAERLTGLLAGAQPNASETTQVSSVQINQLEEITDGEYTEVQSQPEDGEQGELAQRRSGDSTDEADCHGRQPSTQQEHLRQERSSARNPKEWVGYANASAG